MLGPYGSVPLGDNVLVENVYHHACGLPTQYLLFHSGACLTAVRASDARFVVLEHDYTVLDEYASLDVWYRDSLRSEYGSRYGLSDE